MIYSPADVKRILDEVAEEIKKLPYMGSQHIIPYDIEKIVNKMKEKL